MMRKNDEIKLTIHDLHANGHGIGKRDIAVFVPDALPGDQLWVKILKVKKRYAYGKILEIIEPSPYRLSKNDARICPVAERCGGCQFQHFDYNAQLSFKKKLVSDALIRIGDCKSPPVSTVLGMDNPYCYRNKAQFPAGPQGMGFYAPRSHRIIPITDCNIQLCGEVFRAVQDILGQYPIPVYDEETHCGLLRHVVIRVSENTKEVMIIFVLNGNTLPYVEEIKTNLPFTLIVNENTAKTNVILGPKFTTLQGSGYIHEEIGHIRYRISPRAFFQINTAQTKVLYDIIKSHLNGGEKVIDAYSGIGGIALYIAGKVHEVIGIESVPEAVEDGVHNADLNGIKNAKFLCGLAEEVLPDLLNQDVDVLVLDPPRKGCDRKLLDAAIAAKIPKIIYVSCDPATLARDVKQLTSEGYRLDFVQPVDLFPMTGHIETVCVLINRKFTIKNHNTHM